MSKFSRYEIFAAWNFRWIGSKQDFHHYIFANHRSIMEGSTCYVLLQISNCCKLANFCALNFRCIHRWSWNPWNLHTAENSTRMVCVLRLLNGTQQWQMWLCLRKPVLFTQNTIIYIIVQIMMYLLFSMGCTKFSVLNVYYGV